MKIKRLFLILFLISFVNVNAQIKSGDNVVIDQRMQDDVYVAGGKVNINAPISRDLIAAGGTIIVNDSIAMDALLVGGDIMVNGIVGDDIRCAGGTIHFSEDILGDLVVTGGKITIDDDVVISGDLIISGGEIILNGTVNGEIKSASGAFTLNGVAANNVDCRGGRIIINGRVNGNASLAADELRVGDDASFAQTVNYWTANGSAEFRNSMKTGSPVYDPSLKLDYGKWHLLGFTSLLMVTWYLGTALLFIALIHYLFSNTFRNAANSIKNAALRSIGLGFLFLVAVPVAIVVLAVTVVGFPLAVLILFAYIIIVLLGTIITSLLVANWINNNFQKSWTSIQIVFSAFGIFVFLKLATLTPLVGPLIMLLMAVMGFGGILQNIRWKRNSKLALT